MRETWQETLVRKLILILLFSSLIGCNSRPDFYVSSVHIRQTAWDSVEVILFFEESDFFGRRTPIVPEEYWTTIFDAAYDTLYVGSEPWLPIPDIELGDSEEILIEGCGISNSRRACEQRSVRASPKRMDVTSSIIFPVNEAYDRGTYRFDYSMFRQNYGGEAWKRIRPRNQPETYLKAFVHGNESDAVEIPVRRTRNQFNISRFPHYRDFRFHIKSSMMDSDSAQVDFDLYALLGEIPTLVSTDTVVIRPKSHAERIDELALLVELAGGNILDRLKGFFGLGKAYVFINDWSYQPLTKLYVAEIELHWQSDYQSEWYDMIGTLQIKSDGTAGQYEWQQGSRTAERRWFSEIEGLTITFDSLRSDVGMRPRLDSETGTVKRPGF